MKATRILSGLGLGLILTTSSYGAIAEKKDMGKEVDTTPESRGFFRHSYWREHHRTMRTGKDFHGDRTSRQDALLDLYDWNGNGKLDNKESRALNKDRGFLSASERHSTRRGHIRRMHVSDSRVEESNVNVQSPKVEVTPPDVNVSSSQK
jgi:hypothetical protein